MLDGFGVKRGMTGRIQKMTNRFAGKPRSNGIIRNLPEQRMFCAPSPDGLPDISVSLE
jgi:hypothetical protein